MKGKDTAKAEELKAQVGATKQKLAESEQSSVQLEGERDAKLCMIGNIVHMDILVSRDEEKSAVVGSYGTPDGAGAA